MDTDLALFYKVSIHALLAECDKKRVFNPEMREVSIHALLAECDWESTVANQYESKFQSTHSLRSATNGLACK